MQAGQSDLIIGNVNDWDTFAKPIENVELDLIVDPMIYRTADVFLRGKTGVGRTLHDAGHVGKAIRRNVDSLVTFVDLFILAKNLPIIDYGITFDQQAGFDPDDLIQKCNQFEKILISVHVHGEASQGARDAAFEVMKDRTPIPSELAEDLREEMMALEYNWTPDLSPLGFVLEDQLPVNRFLYGAALFGAFAQSAGVGHIFQPRRSQIYLAASLHADSMLAQDEYGLYKKLAEVMGKASGEVSSIAQLAGLPPFLPYLLSKDPKTPTDLLSKAVELRKKPMVKDYRNWRNGLIGEWLEKGRIRARYRKELSSIAEKVKKEIVAPVGSNVELKVSMTGIDPSWKVPVDQIWGWIYSQVPGRRYMKLLTQLAVAQAEYEEIDRHIATIWSAA